MDSGVYFVENLTLQAWVLSVWPHLLNRRQRIRGGTTRCYVIDGSRLAVQIARASAWMAGASVEKLTFSLVSLRDESGLQIRLRITHEGLVQVQQDAVAEPVFQELARGGLLKDRLPTFLAKSIADLSVSDRSTTWRALVLTEVSNWKVRQEEQNKVATLFLENRPWLKVIQHYASQRNVTIIPIPPALNLRAALRRRIPANIIGALRFLRYSRSNWRLWSFDRRASRGPGEIAASKTEEPLQESGDAVQGSRPRVAVEHMGQLNLKHLERHSELFFWQKSALSGSDVLVTFANPNAPLDEETWDQLREQGMAAVVLHPGATTIPTAPVFTHHHRNSRTPSGKASVMGYGLESKWLRNQIADYHRLRDYWTDLFATHNVKVFVTWYTNDKSHCVIADALQALGGVTAVYQRSFESLPSTASTVDADILFGFSPSGAEVERISNSVIRYHVATGYLGDHRFALLRHQAQTMRQTLQQRGAKYLLAFFDENTGDDGRWINGHHWTQENYAFLLEKVLSEPQLGLLLKPKAPNTLRRRLGPVAALLERAEATGRCYVYEASGTGQGWYPPAAAALAADIAIHGHMCSASAGIDAALAGVPTLLLDREGWPVSQFYQLGVGRVVFQDWERLWESCQQHWSTPGGIPGFGDWSPMLEELDPFRDGRAAERMGTYIQWLLQGFEAGLDRETVMANAAERYCGIWGTDKITQVNVTQVNKGVKAPYESRRH
jgi:hypothetical protein